MSKDKKYIRVVDIPKAYSISRMTIYRHAKAGRIKIHKLGSASLVSVADMKKLIEGSEA